jgi:hypothetical protein
MDDDLCIHDMVPAHCSSCLARTRPPVIVTTRGTTTTPTSPFDRIRPLDGDLDISVPVPDMAGSFGADWVGAWFGYPRRLRPRGILYLRSDGSLLASAAVVGMSWSGERPPRPAAPDVVLGDLDPGLVFRLDPTSWEHCELALPEPARDRHGYRYLRVVDGVVTTFYDTGRRQNV